MTELESLTAEFLASQPADHRRLRERVFRCVLIELPGYVADIQASMTLEGGVLAIEDVEAARERLQERVRERYRQRCGFIGLTLVLVLTTIILSAIAWCVRRILDHLFPEQLQQLACEAEQFRESEGEE